MYAAHSFDFDGIHTLEKKNIESRTLHSNESYDLVKVKILWL